MTGRCDCHGPAHLIIPPSSTLIDPPADQDYVPVPVLEALASAWEDQAESNFEELRRQGAPLAKADIQPLTLRSCARMLREAITHQAAS